MGHKRKEGVFFSKKPILQWLRKHANEYNRDLCVSAEAASKARKIIEEFLASKIKDAMQIRKSVGEKTLVVAHFRIAEEARRKKQVKDIPIASVAKKRRGRPARATNK